MDCLKGRSREGQAMTILTPVKAQDWATFILQAQLLQFNAQAVAQKQRGLSADFQQKVNSINLDADKWLDIQADIKDAVDFLDNVVKRLETIRGHLDDMLSTAFKARNGDTHSAWTYPIKFDVSFRGLISTAEDRGANPNLLGSAQHRNFTYKINDIGETETISRTFLGSDYYITDSTGKIWTRDRSSFLLRQRDATTGAKTGEFAALTGGLRLDSLSGSAITFTTAPDTADARPIPAPFPGAVSRFSTPGFTETWNRPPIGSAPKTTFIPPKTPSTFTWPGSGALSPAPGSTKARAMSSSMPSPRRCFPPSI